MAVEFRITGMRKVLRNLNKEIRKIEGRSGEGIRLAAIHTLGVALPITPVDTGNLRGSKFTNPPRRTGSGPVVDFGFDANYAAYVHERTELRHKAPTQAKFLEEALKRSEKQILNIIRATAKVR